MKTRRDASVLTSSTPPPGGWSALAARTVVLATGGASRVYLYSTNPEGSTGDGIAMAMARWLPRRKYGVQPVPSDLPVPSQGPVVPDHEAVRGEGGRLVRPNGTRFMDEYDPRGELAPRDIVARAIDEVMKREGHDCVYLDISHQGADFHSTAFPDHLR